MFIAGYSLSSPLMVRMKYLDEYRDGRIARSLGAGTVLLVLGAYGDLRRTDPHDHALRHRRPALRGWNSFMVEAVGLRHASRRSTGILPYYALRRDLGLLWRCCAFGLVRSAARSGVRRSHCHQQAVKRPRVIRIARSSFSRLASRPRHLPTPWRRGWQSARGCAICRCLYLTYLFHLRFVLCSRLLKIACKDLSRPGTCAR